MIDRMEVAGLVCRALDKNDRRKTLLTLTEKAKNLIVGSCGTYRFEGLWLTKRTDLEITLNQSFLFIVAIFSKSISTKGTYHNASNCINNLFHNIWIIF